MVRGMRFVGVLGRALAIGLAAVGGLSPASAGEPLTADTFVVGEWDGKKALVIREAQHEYALI
jgi:hypothetical protein